jgi:hypothetical protein
MTPKKTQISIAVKLGCVKMAMLKRSEMAKKKPAQQKFTTYSNLTKNRGKSKHAVKKDAAARQRAEYLATLPKNPFLRFLSHFHPKRVFKYWFSKRGLKMFGKIVGITALVIIIGVGFFLAISLLFNIAILTQPSFTAMLICVFFGVMLSYFSSFSRCFLMATRDLLKSIT